MTGSGDRPVCGERASLPTGLVHTAWKFAPDIATAGDIQRELRCTLEQHTGGDHHAFVMHLAGTDSGSVWTRWTRGNDPATVLVLLDCDAVSPGPGFEPCCEFASHSGGHTWQVADPWRAPIRLSDSTPVR